jgi:transposase-like protein/transcriptional regulator with XRE-family HTH domain
MRALPQTEKILKLAASGHTVAEAAQETGLKSGNLRRWASRHGVIFVQDERHLIPEEKKARIAELAEAGYSKRQAERELGVGHGSLTLHAEKSGIIFSQAFGPGSRLKNAHSPWYENYAEVIRLSKLNYSRQRIARITGVSIRTVERYRAMENLSKPAKPSPTEEQLAEMKRWLDDGASYAETGRTVGYSGTAVQRYFPGHGMSAQERGQMANAIRRANQKMKRLGLE